MGALRRGEVAAFDEARGLGAVTDSSTGEEFPFHCTAISDGSRTVRVGAPVVFMVAPALLGTIEAVEVLSLVPSA